MRKVNEVLGDPAPPATEADLESTLTDIETGVGKVAAHVADLDAQILALQAAGPSAVTQEQLDQLVARSRKVKQDLAPIDGDPTTDSAPL
jgi:peptidoglycan hydrolase CwlO-like protein